MKFRARLLAVGTILAACLFVGGSAFGDQISAVSADFLATSFSNTGGTYSLGVLTIDNDADIVAEYAVPTVIYHGGHALLTTSLFQDCSTGGVAYGIFKGGSIVLEDNTATALLTATIDTLEIAELQASPDMLAGQGTFVVTGGSLAGDFGMSVGDVFTLTFELQPAGIIDFSESGAGVSNVKLTPIPEPGVCLLLGTACLSALGWMRRRRMVD